MQLVLGHPRDTCCAAVLESVRKRNCDVRLVSDVLIEPSRLTWQLDDRGVSARLMLDGDHLKRIDGVLVRDAGWLDASGWDPADHAYMQGERQATLLAWLAALDCPVVNRPSADLWYRPRRPLLAWRRLLHRAGLSTPQTSITNEPSQARAFALGLARDLRAPLCTPLTGNDAWLIAHADWEGLSRLQRHTPVCLAEPHGRPLLACVVGDRVVWDRAPPADIASLSPALRRFADAAGLVFVEIGIAAVHRGPAVVLVEPRVELHDFEPTTRERIVEALVDVLTGQATCVRSAAEASS